MANRLYSKLDDGNVHVSASTSSGKRELLEDDDVEDSEDVTDGIGDPVRNNFKTIKTYHDALMCMLRKVESEYLQASGLCFKRKHRALRRLAENQINQLCHLRRWALGTTQFRRDATGETGISGLMFKTEVALEWNNMKQNQKSFKRQFKKENNMANNKTFWRTVGKKEKTNLKDVDNPSSYGGHNGGHEDIEGSMTKMADDFEDAHTALYELASDYVTIRSSCFIVRFFGLKWCLFRYMANVNAITVKNVVSC